MSKRNTPEPPTGAANRRLADGHDDLLIQEEPLLLVVHDQQLLTMRTPGRDAELALGFLLGEGIVQSREEVVDITCIESDEQASTPDEVRVTLAAAPAGMAKARLTRTHEIRSSCGACGISDPQAILDGTPALLPGVPRFEPLLLSQLLTRLTEQQELFSLTGGCHGALLATTDGTVVGCAEDVGRHNALDKAIGEAAKAGAEFPQLVAMLSGRAGFDLIVKCLRVRVPVIASVSAPSALAFDLCHAAGATLIGFVRGERHEVYCGSERLRTS